MGNLQTLLNLIDGDKFALPENGAYKAFVLLNKNTYGLQKTTKIELEAYAIYDCKNPKAKQGCNRYYLEFEIKNPVEKQSWTKSDILITLLQNPSNTIPKENNTIKIDTTVQNVIRMAYLSGYKKSGIFNTFSLIDGNSYDTKKFLKENSNKDKTDVNTKFIKQYFESLQNKTMKDFDFLVAWGSGKNILNQIEKAEYHSIINTVKNKWAYGINESDTPTHPGNLAQAAVPFIKRILNKDYSNGPFKIDKILPDGTVLSNKTYK